MKEVKIEWCRNFVKATFAKLPEGVNGIEVNCFWRLAEKSGLWERDTYGTPMSKALEELTKVKIVQNDDGDYLYSAFYLA